MSQLAQIDLGRIYQSRSSLGPTMPGMEAYNALCDEAATYYEGFLAHHARELLHWHEPFTRILHESNAPFYKWFEDGRLNASYNCLERNVESAVRALYLGFHR